MASEKKLKYSEHIQPMYIQLLIQPLKFIRVIKLIKMSNTSLFIPHVFANYTASDVAAVFEKLRIGSVSSVNLVQKTGKDKKVYSAAYIKFHYWYDNVAALNFQERVLNPEKEARLVYDEPWYWVVLPYYSKTDILLQQKQKKEQELLEARQQEAIQLQQAFEEEQQLDEIEALMQEEDKDLVTIDSRYVQTLEKELQEAREYMQRLYQAYLEQSVLIVAQQQPAQAMIAVVSP